ncbi:MAG: hypothetical protein ABR554_05555 [Pyrinomonadaceae bacterium]
MNIGITVYPTYGGSGIVGSELGRSWRRAGTRFTSSPLRCRRASPS